MLKLNILIENTENPGLRPKTPKHTITYHFAHRFVSQALLPTFGFNIKQMDWMGYRGGRSRNPQK